MEPVVGLGREVAVVFVQVVEQPACFPSRPLQYLALSSRTSWLYYVRQDARPMFQADMESKL